MKRGISFNDDGSITFEEWPDRPHDQIIGEFTVIFTTEFVSPYQNQAAIHPVLESDGMTGNILVLRSRFDIRIFGFPVIANDRTMPILRNPVRQIRIW